jgi:hypothetical protein
MRVFLSSLFIITTCVVVAQQQQVRPQQYLLTNNLNPVVQVAQTNIGNYQMANDNNIGNPGIFMMNENENFNNFQAQSFRNSRQRNEQKPDFGISMRSPSRSSSNSSSSSRSNRHAFSKKLRKIERHLQGKFERNNKNKHLVDICFNWK